MNIPLKILRRLGYGMKSEMGFRKKFERPGTVYEKSYFGTVYILN